jgi:hypothetical protein
MTVSTVERPGRIETIFCPDELDRNALPFDQPRSKGLCSFAIDDEFLFRGRGALERPIIPTTACRGGGRNWWLDLISFCQQP